MLGTVPFSGALNTENDLRRQIDRSVSRALADEAYASLLLSDPTVALEDHVCHPRDYWSLSRINASTLVDFARQARELFWALDTHQLRSSSPAPREAARAPG